MTRATPADLRALLATLPAFYSRDPDRLARLEETVHDLIAERERAVVVFRPGSSPGEWVIGADERVIPCALRALPALHAAIHYHGAGRAVHAAEFVSPGSKRAGNSVRNGQRRAVAWAERVACCRELASALRSVHVTRDGIVRYEPLPSTPKIITD